MDLSELLNKDTSNTRTEHMARELHRASWLHNEGRTVYDIPLYDALDEFSKQQLMDTVAAVEVLLTQFPNEEYELTRYNVAVTLYDAYHAHPFWDGPRFPFNNAPTDMKKLWMSYAKFVLDKYYETRYLLPAENFTRIEVAQR